MAHIYVDWLDPKPMKNDALAALCQTYVPEQDDAYTFRKVIVPGYGYRS